MTKNIGTLDTYDQRRLWKCICIVNPLDIFLKSQTSNLSLDKNNLKWGEILWNKIFHFSNTRKPLEILVSKISLKYIPIHIHNFEHSVVIMNM